MWSREEDAGTEGIDLDCALDLGHCRVWRQHANAANARSGTTNSGTINLRTAIALVHRPYGPSH